MTGSVQNRPIFDRSAERASESIREMVIKLCGMGETTLMTSTS